MRLHNTIAWTNNQGQRFTFTSTNGIDYTVPNSLHGVFRRIVDAQSQTTGYRFNSKDGMQHYFDVTGKLTSIKDIHDNALVLTYDGNGRVSTVKSAPMEAIQ